MGPILETASVASVDLTALNAGVRRRMLDQLPAPVELGHRLIDKREAQISFEVVVGRLRSGPFSR